MFVFLFFNVSFPPVFSSKYLPPLLFFQCMYPSVSFMCTGQFCFLLTFFSPSFLSCCLSALSSSPSLFLLTTLWASPGLSPPPMHRMLLGNRHRRLEEQQRVLGNVACWQISNCQVNRELAVKNASHLQASAPPCRRMLTAGWLVTWVHGVCCMGQSSPESPWVVPWAGTCGQPKACFVSVRVPQGQLGADNAWRCSAEVHGEGFDSGGKRASGKLSEGVGWWWWWAEPPAQRFCCFLLQYAWPQLNEKPRKSVLQMQATQGLSLGAVCACRAWIIATDWVEPAHGEYPAQGETAVYVFLSQSTFIYCSWLEAFSKWKLAYGPPAACKTCQLGWGRKVGGRSSCFWCFPCSASQVAKLQQIASPRTTGCCSQ